MVVVFLVGVGIFLWVTFFSDMFRQDENTLRVPNLLGQNISDVLQDGDVLEHFNVVEQSRQASDEYEEGQIISQDPVAGTEVTAGEVDHHHQRGGQLRAGHGGDDQRGGRYL